MNIFKHLPRLSRYYSTQSFKGDTIILSENYSPLKCKTVLEKDTISVLGYCHQVCYQSLNLRDNRHNVILGLRKYGNSWHKAINYGWIQDTFSIDEVAYKGTIKYLISDAVQIYQWNSIKPNLDT